MSILKGSLGFKGEKGDNGVSPTVAVSKVDGTATITITDIEGEHTTTVSDGEITKAMVVDDLTHTDIDKPLSANQGKVLKTAVDAKANTADIVDNLNSVSNTVPLSAKQGNVLKNIAGANLDTEDIYVLSHTFALGDTGCTFDFPTGFNKANSLIISILAGHSYTYGTGGQYTGSDKIEVFYSTLYEKIVVNVSSSFADTITIVLLKLPTVKILRHEATEVTSSTVYIAWETDTDRDKTQYSLDNGSTWTDAVDEIVDNKHGGYEISGLTSGTTYSIKSRFKRASTQMWTESTALSVTTE